MKTQFLMSRVYKSIEDNGIERMLNRNNLFIVQNNAELAAELIRNNDVEEIDGSLYEEYNEKINSLYRNYKKEIEEIENSKDPIYDVESNGNTKRFFDIKGLMIELDREVEAIKHEYYEIMDETISEAIKTDALAVTVFTPSDELLVKSIVKKFEVNSIIDYNEAKESFKTAITYMTLEQLAALGEFVSDIKTIIDTHESNQVLAKTLLRMILDKVQSAQPISKEDALKQLKSIRIGDEYSRGKAILQSKYKLKEEASLQR